MEPWDGIGFAHPHVFIGTRTRQRAAGRCSTGRSPLSPPRMVAHAPGAPRFPPRPSSPSPPSRRGPLAASVRPATLPDGSDAPVGTVVAPPAAPDAMPPAPWTEHAPPTVAGIAPRPSVPWQQAHRTSNQWVERAGCRSSACCCPPADAQHATTQDQRPR